jgi:hypothetical protein
VAFDHGFRFGLTIFLHGGLITKEIVSFNSHKFHADTSLAFL